LKQKFNGTIKASMKSNFNKEQNNHQTFLKSNFNKEQNNHPEF